jgi:hypothetical protein
MVAPKTNAIVASTAAGSSARRAGESVRTNVPSTAASTMNPRPTVIRGLHARPRDLPMAPVRTASSSTSCMTTEDALGETAPSRVNATLIASPSTSADRRNRPTSSASPQTSCAATRTHAIGAASGRSTPSTTGVMKASSSP